MNPNTIEKAREHITYCFENNENLTEDDIILFLKAVCRNEWKRLNLNPISLHIMEIENKTGKVGFYAGQMKHRYNLRKRKWEHSIIINQELIRTYIKNRTIYNLINILNTLLHEIRHYYQHTLIMKPFDLSEPEAIIWYKEYHMVDMFKKYDSENYWNLFIERDARMSANKRVKAYLKEFYLEQYTKYQSVFDSYLKMRKKHYFEISHKNPQKRYQKKNQAIPQITHYFSHYIQNKTKQELMELYANYRPGEEPYISPLFAFEYHVDGTKKTYVELMYERDLLIKRMMDKYSDNKEIAEREIDKINKYYQFIVQTDKNLELTTLINLMFKELQYHQPNTKEYLDVYRRYSFDINCLKKQINNDKKEYKNIYQSNGYKIKQAIVSYFDMISIMKKDLEKLFLKDNITDTHIKIRRIK